MTLKTGKEYVESLKRMKTEIYARGERVEKFWEYPGLQSTIQAWGRQVYDSAFDPKLRSLLVVKGFDGQDTHSYWNFPHSRQELINEYNGTFELAKKMPLSGYVSIPRDALVGALVAAYKTDKKYGTPYFERTLNYCKHFQKNQLLGAAAVTDTKGHRGLRPADQKDPDMYVHIVEKRKDGVVVRGAKAHTTGGAVSNELIFIPQRHMRQEDKDYAIAFAIPTDTPGVRLVLREAQTSTSELDAPVSRRDEASDTFTVLDDVFVPNDRVFLCGEPDFARDAAYYFSTINRTPWCADTAGIMYMHVGAAALISDYNGVSDAPHIRDKLFRMISAMITEYSLGFTSCSQSSGIDLGKMKLEIPNAVPTNVGKHFGLDEWFVMSRFLQEIAGGATVTLASSEDIRTPPQSKWIEKYFRGVPEVPTLDRIKVLKLIRDLTCSEYAGWWYSAIVNGSGAPAAERIIGLRDFDLESAKKNVREILEIK